MDRDAGLMAGLASGRRAALEETYRLLKDDLLSAAYHLLGDRPAAEDVLHDVFVRLARGGRRPPATASLRPYLVTCCLNRARDVLRRRRLGPDPVPSLDDRHATGTGPADEAAHRDEAALVAATLRDIPEEQREVVVLRVYGRLRFREIADTLAISINTAQSRHRYALEALRNRLAGTGAER